MNDRSCPASRSLPLALLLAASSLLLACGDDGTAAASSGGGSDGAGGGSSASCGTVENPVLLTLEGVTPAAGASVANLDIVHTFTIVGGPGLIQELSFLLPSAHTAGAPDPAQLAFTITQDSDALTYTAAPLQWESAPGRVELQVQGAFQDDAGCVFAFPSPLFAYDLTPAAGGGGGGGQGGESGEGGGGQGGGQGGVGGSGS